MITKIDRVTRHTLAATLVVVVFPLFPFVSFGQSGPEGYPSVSDPPLVERAGRGDVAVIVALESYDHLPPVRGAVANANDWKTVFRRGLGVGTVYVVVNEDAT